MGKVGKLDEFFRFSGVFLAIAVNETVGVNHAICAIMPYMQVVSASGELFRSAVVAKLF